MTGSLTDAQVQQYWTEGYVNRLPILTRDEAAGWLDRLETIEAQETGRHGGAWTDRGYRPWEHDTSHPMAEFVHTLATLPALLDAVESVLGPDILIRNADIFLKEPGLRRGIGWHQDTAEYGDDVDGMLTAWLGLTASAPDNGGLRFSTRTHRGRIPHGPTDKYHLTLTKEAVAHLDAARTVDNVMEPGEASLHHFRLVHASGPNPSAQRRVGFVVRYMAPTVTAATAESGQATLVRGAYTRGDFTLKPHFPLTWSM